MAKLLLPTFTLLLLVVILPATPISAQSPAAAPSPSGPINLTAILDKAGQFTTFIRLLQNTKVSDQINTQLNNSNQGLTIFAPTDNAFSGLKPGILNSFSDQQKVELIQFHVLPSVLSASEFQTASNPLRTQAGGSQFQLNVTTSGNQVNITTGATNATVANTVYTDSRLAVYQVDRVLLPLAFFTSPAPAPAPSPKSKKAARSGDSPSDNSMPADSSGGVSRSRKSGEAIVACLVVLVLVGFA